MTTVATVSCLPVRRKLDSVLLFPIHHGSSSPAAVRCALFCCSAKSFFFRLSACILFARSIKAIVMQKPTTSPANSTRQPRAPSSRREILMPKTFPILRNRQAAASPFLQGLGGGPVHLPPGMGPNRDASALNSGAFYQSAGTRGEITGRWPSLFPPCQKPTAITTSSLPQR